MSDVTNIIISASLYGAQQMFKAQLDAFTNSIQVPGFVHLDKCAQGGDNCLRVDLFVGAFKNLDMALFMHFFRSLHYAGDDADYKQTLQVFIKRSCDLQFSSFTQDTIEQWQ